MGIVKDYFSFSKRERTGALVLVILIVVIFLLPEFLPPSTKISGLEVLNDSSLKTNTLSGNTFDSSSYNINRGRFKEHRGDFNDNIAGAKQGRLFYFDPNFISEQDWIELGISERTARTIKKFLSKGGSFKKAEDIGKIYGLSRAQYGRLLPYVRIKENDEVPQSRQRNFTPEHSTKMLPPRSPRPVVDINVADTAALIALPGIGSKLASRIINFRSKLGGFHSIEQVKEVYGLADSTYDLIKPLLSVNSTIQKINLNETTVEELKSHPYLRWNIANAIINYRTQHGRFEKLEDLLEIDIITPEILKKAAPYLAID